MWEEANPYAAPVSSSRERIIETDERSWILRTVRALTVGPALTVLVLLAFASLAAPAHFPLVVSAMFLLHIADRTLFRSKKFVG